MKGRWGNRLKSERVEYLGAEGGAIGENNPAGLVGGLAKDLVNVSARRETIATMLPQAMEDVSGDSPSLPLSHLGLLLVALAPLPFLHLSQSVFSSEREMLGV